MLLTMGTDSFYARYRESQQRRTTRALTSPLLIGAVVALAWIFFRWWPALVMTAWLAVCVGLALRIRRSGV
jgi:hypothetical protein